MIRCVTHNRNQFRAVRYALICWGFPKPYKWRPIEGVGLYTAIRRFREWLKAIRKYNP